MTIPTLPLEIMDYIFCTISHPEKYTEVDTKVYGKELVNFALLNKNIYSICKKNLNKIKKIFNLLNKYNIYEKAYKTNWHLGEKFNPGGCPLLLDALFSGCSIPDAYHSINYYDKTIEKDIKEIVKLLPESLNCTLGSCKDRFKASPLFAASINPNIPTRIVEFLFENGANPNESVYYRGIPIPTLRDLKHNILPQSTCKDRLKKIIKLFEKYGAKA